MKKIFKYLAVVGISLVACNPLQLDEIVDPNNPSVASVSSNATRSQIQFLVTGLESRHRGYVVNVSQAWNTFGREIWYLNSSDQRFQTDWLGQAGRVPDAAYFGFGTTGGGSYASPYQAIRQAELLMSAVENTILDLDPAVDAAQKSAVRGFAKTIMGYQFMIPANFMYSNGIRIDVKDPLNPGPYVTYQQGLQHAEDLLDEAYDELGAGGTTFPFTLTSGWTGFNSNTGLRQVNRAIAARLNAYQQDWQGVLDALDDSFMNVAGNLNAGPSHPYSGPPDVFNPLFYVQNAAITTIIVVHPSVIDDATPGDKRVADKFHLRTTPVTVTTDVGALVGTHQDKRWASNTTAIPFIRNEELILLKAEAHANLNQTTDAVDAINIIRQAAQIGDYLGATDLESLIDEILYQRRYSLWAEPWGHRWIDARRYDRLNEIPTSYDQGTIFTQFPRPQADLSWDLYTGN
jgi:hypothetical protein